jgi:hypothetical protein
VLQINNGFFLSSKSRVTGLVCGGIPVQFHSLAGAFLGSFHMDRERADGSVIFLYLRVLIGDKARQKSSNNGESHNDSRTNNHCGKKR